MTSAAAAVRAAALVGYPVVMKASGARIAHKTELGLVRIGLTSASQVRDAYRELTDTARYEDVSLDGVLVCQMVERGVEMVVGATRDPLLGPTVTAGLGGVLVEVLHDTAVRMPPFGEEQARDNGTAAGRGAHPAFACDLVLAAESATFIEVFVRRGLVPDGGGAYLLPRLVGPQRAKELMFFGDALTAADAERLCLVNRVLPDGELDRTAREWAERLAAGPTRALALAKQLVNASLDAGRATAFAAEAAAQEINMTTQDARDGVASFARRRRPGFEGR